DEPPSEFVITTHALFARKVQRKLSNGVAGFAAGGSSSDRKGSRPIRAFSATPHDRQRPCRTLAEDPGRTQPRAAYPRRCFGSDPGNPRELGCCRPRKHPCRDPGLRPSCVSPTPQLKRE